MNYTGELRRAERTVPHSYFVDLPKERVARRVKHAAASDVEIESGSAIARNRPGDAGGKNAIIVQFQRLSGSDGGEVVPLEIGKGIGRVDLAHRGPQFDRRAVDETELDGVVLAEQTRARGLNPCRPNPTRYREGGTSVQQSAWPLNEIIHAVELGGRIIRLENGELRRTRPRAREGDTVMIRAIGRGAERTAVQRDCSARLTETPIGQRLRFHYLS